LVLETTGAYARSMVPGLGADSVHEAIAPSTR